MYHDEVKVAKYILKDIANTVRDGIFTLLRKISESLICYHLLFSYTYIYILPFSMQLHFVEMYYVYFFCKNAAVYYILYLDTCFLTISLRQCTHK